MPKPTYRRRGLVLKKTRLGETDLIVSVLTDEGALIRAVAKGARKPKSSFASRLETYAVVDLLVANGRNLATITEAHLIEGHGDLRSSPEATFAAAPIVDLAGRIAQPDLALAHIFDATVAGLTRLESIARPPMGEMRAPDGDELASMLGMTDALLLKDLAFAGLRPSFSQCVVCGAPLDLREDAFYRFSPREGGVLCDTCSSGSPYKKASGATMLWAHHFLYKPLDAILAQHPPVAGALSILALAQDFIAAHTGSPLRSIECLVKSRIFDPAVCAH